MAFGDLGRRLLIGAGLSAALPVYGNAAPSAEPRAALMAFLAAFENGDLTAMQAAFADDAVCFDQAVMSPRGGPENGLAPYRLKSGFPTGMRQAVEQAKKARSSPPYLSLIPSDLVIQVSGGIAVCSFHLVREHYLARRTIVLALRSGAWKITHLHASTVIDA